MELENILLVKGVFMIRARMRFMILSLMLHGHLMQQLAYGNLQLLVHQFLRVKQKYMVGMKQLLIGMI